MAIYVFGARVNSRINYITLNFRIIILKCLPKSRWHLLVYNMLCGQPGPDYGKYIRQFTYTR